MCRADFFSHIVSYGCNIKNLIFEDFYTAKTFKDKFRKYYASQYGRIKSILITILNFKLAKNTSLMGKVSLKLLSTTIALKTVFIVVCHFY
jgi:hypothetical protein